MRFRSLVLDYKAEAVQIMREESNRETKRGVQTLDDQSHFLCLFGPGEDANDGLLLEAHLALPLAIFAPLDHLKVFALEAAKGEEGLRHRLAGCRQLSSTLIL